MTGEMGRHQSDSATATPSMRPSGRCASLPISPIRRLAPLAEAARARGIHVHHLNIGQPDLDPPPSVVEALERAGGEVLAYAPSRGYADVVEAWRAYYRGHGIETEPGDILVTAGASEALTFALHATCDPGDEIIVPEPFYAPYKGIAALAGVRIVAVPRRDGFRPPSADAIRARLSPRTRAILICSPNNPTGTVFTRDELAEIGGLAREAGLFLLSDETYRELVFDGPPAPSALSIPGLDEYVVVIDSLSKRFNVCGLRIGSLVTRNTGVMAAALEMAELRLAVPVVDQRAVVGALGTPGEYVKWVVDTYRVRRDATIGALARLPGARVSPPDGAFYAVVGLPVRDAERFAAWLLGDFSIDGETVMLTPMADFYGTPGQGRDEVRLAFVLDADTLVRAVSIIGAGLRAFPEDGE